MKRTRRLIPIADYIPDAVSRQALHTAFKATMADDGNLRPYQFRARIIVEDKAVILCDDDEALSMLTLALPIDELIHRWTETLRGLVIKHNWGGAWIHFGRPHGERHRHTNDDWKSPRKGRMQKATWR